MLPGAYESPCPTTRQAFSERTSPSEWIVLAQRHSEPLKPPVTRPQLARLPGSRPRFQWIQPTKTVESREIMVGAVQFCLMFHGERGELGVGCQIGGRPELGKIVHEESLKTGAGVQDADRGLGQPGAYVADG